MKKLGHTIGNCPSCGTNFFLLVEKEGKEIWVCRHEWLRLQKTHHEDLVSRAAAA